MPALRCRKVKAHRRSTSSFHPHPQPVLPLEHANPPEHPYHAGLRKEVEENGGEERRGEERMGQEKRGGERRGEIGEGRGVEEWWSGEERRGEERNEIEMLRVSW